MSVLRYAQRLAEPLVITDATCDDRFAGDPYFTDIDRCSFVALPILSRGHLRAMLLLENRLIRGAFTTERLDAVKLIAGQLAVSLDNAQLYSELVASRARVVATADQTRRQIERDLHDGAQQRLVSLALELRIAQAEVSTGSGTTMACTPRRARAVRRTWACSLAMTAVDANSAGVRILSKWAATAPASADCPRRFGRGVDRCVRRRGCQFRPADREQKAGWSPRSTHIAGDLGDTGTVDH